MKTFDKKSYYSIYNQQPKVKEARRKAQKRYYIKHKDKVCEWQKNHSKTPMRKYKSYQIEAKNRNLNFDISFDEFNLFWQQPCYYCGSEIATVGLDRMNNKFGYKIDNLVACCKVCNYMKRTLTVEMFLEHCERIVNHLSNKND